MELKVKKIIIYTPELNEKIGGIIVLHNLAKELIDLGYNAMLYVVGEKRYNNVFCNNFATEEDIDNDSVVVYPEIVEGNPLGAKNVVRWILCELGKHCEWNIYKTWGKDDLVFHFSTFNSNNNKKDIEVLYNVWINPLVKNKGLKRRGSCYLFKKASKFHKDINLIHPKDAILIDNCTFEEIIDIFNEKEFFYCYDPYSFHDSIAALCGCIPIIYPIDGINKLEWLNTRAIFHVFKGKKDDVAGVAYGIDNVDYAKNTLSDAWKERKDIIEYGKRSIVRFVDIIQEYFFQSTEKEFITVEKASNILGWNMRANTVAKNGAAELDREEIKDNMIFEITKSCKMKDEEIQKRDLIIREKNSELKTIKSSKFWKLRNLYIKIKHYFIFIFLNPRKFVKKCLNSFKDER